MGPHIDFSPHQNHVNGYLHGTHCCKMIIFNTPYILHTINSLMKWNDEKKNFYAPNFKEFFPS